MVSPDRDYHFSTDWFQRDARPVWDSLIPQLRPRRILEVGSFEGQSTCYLIDTLAGGMPLEIHCIDTWEGGIEHSSIDMNSVEQRFHHNVNLAVEAADNPVRIVVHKGYSDVRLAKLLATDKSSYFDLAYIDGSHQAPDVLCDATLAFRLVRPGGYLIFDDYNWFEQMPYGKDPIRSPKMAVDAFTNIYFRKLNLIRAPLYQVYAQKLSD